MPAQVHAHTVLIRLPIPLVISDGDASHRECRKDLNLMLAKLSLHCDSPRQSKPRLQTSSPSVSGAILSSIIGVHFRHGAVWNGHSATVLKFGGCASRSNGDKQADSAYEALAIATHTMSQQRLLEELKSAARWLQSAASNAEESQTETRFLRRCMSTGIGTQYHRELVGLSGA